MTRSIPDVWRRVRQTIRSFENGPAVLAQLATGRLAGRPVDLVFQVAGGPKVRTPNLRGARVPVYELFVEDSYSLPWFTAGLQEPTAVDIGAHVGCFALAFATSVPGSSVVAFEATPSTYGYLTGNVAANALDKRIACHNTAVASTTGSITFGVTGAGSGHNGVLHLGTPGTATIEVPSVSVRDAFALAAGEVDLVKIDAEGAEYDMILGSSPADWSSVRRVVLEYHGVAGRSWSELEDFFAEAGFSIADHVSSVAGYGLAWLTRDPLGPRP